MQFKRGFASDNNAGVHPEILDYLKTVNKGHMVGYGDDPVSRKAWQTIRDAFGGEGRVHFVFNGTGANVLSIASAVHSFQAVICAETSHIYEDECGAPEHFSGNKLLPVFTSDGKLTVEGIASQMKGIDFVHHVQPGIISITQSTELGTVYTAGEIKEIAGFAREHGLLLHMDGARIYNAAAALNTGLAEITVHSGVDILSLGGTKNGLMLGEAVVIFNRDAAPHFHYFQKQGMQMASKMRFIAAQYEKLFSAKLWLRNASHANEMAKLLEKKVRDIPGIEIVYPVEANAVFAKIPASLIPSLQEEYFFYVWNEKESIVRWMTSFDTEEEDILGFVALLKRLMENAHPSTEG